LPIKYAILCAVGTVIGYYLFSAFGRELSGGLVGAVLAGAGGGFIAGLIRQRKNNDN